MAYQMTDSITSGYMTNTMWDVAIGPFRAFSAHYSAPNATTAYIQVGMRDIRLVDIEDADPTTFRYTADGAGGMYVQFSGLVTGSTGYIFILGF